MNLNETKMLLKEIAVVDNRKLDEALALAWHAIINHLDFETAKESLVLARRDATINYLEPRHIVAWAKEAKHRSTRNAVEEPADFETTPEPLCIHSIKLMSCNACCRAFPFHHTTLEAPREDTSVGFTNSRDPTPFVG